MAKWQDFTAYVDSIKGQLSPDEQRLLARTRDFNSAQGSDQVMKAAQEMLMRRTGMDQRAAMNFINLDKNVLKHGGEDAHAAFGNESVVGSRANYGSDEGYRSALLKSMGIDDGYVEPGSPEAAGAGGGDTRDISSQMQAFIDSMAAGGDLDMSQRAMIQRHAINAAQSYSGRAGMNGRSGIGGSAAASMYTQGDQQWQVARAGIQSQGLGMLSQRDLGLGQLQAGFTNQQNQLAEAKFANQQNSAQGIGALLGGIGGGIVGGYAGGPAGAAAGMQGGSSLGAGIGGLFTQGSGPQYRSAAAPTRRGINPYTGY